MPKITEQHLIVCSGKYEVAIIEDSTQSSVLLKLTTDRHEALRSLFATAELLVLSNSANTDEIS